MNVKSHQSCLSLYSNEVWINIIIYSLEFFTSDLADCLSLEFEWLQVSSSLQDSSQHSDRFIFITFIIIIISSSCSSRILPSLSFYFSTTDIWVAASLPRILRL